MRFLLFAIVGFGLLSAPLSAQALEDYDYENLEFRGLGVDVGSVWPTRADGGISLGIRADLGYVGPHVRVVPSLRFWTARMRQSELDRLGEQVLVLCRRQAEGQCPERLDLGTVRRSDFEIAADGHYVFETGLGVHPYWGAGVGVHFLNARGELINDTFVEDLLDTISPGINLIAGFGVPMGGALELNTEARIVLISDVQYVNVVIGGTWLLPSPQSPFRSVRSPTR